MSKKKINQNSNVMTNTDAVMVNRSRGKLDNILSYLPSWISGSKPTVAILRLEGVIGKVSALKSGLTLAVLNELIEKMFKIDSLEAVCLVINSPGGSPVQSELIATRIIELAKEKDVPVYSFVEDVAASGGYWLACAADKIYVSQSSIIGSIGVISSGFGFHEAIKKMGVERRVYTEGNTKSVLDPFQPAKESDIKIIGKVQKEIYQHFVNTVKERRGGRLTQTDDILFNGEFWTGQIALDYGLVDGIDNLYSFIQKRYGSNVKIEYIKNSQSWFKKKLGITQIREEFATDLAENIVNSVEKRLVSSKFEIK